jgi:hypothetical protein
MPGAEAEFEGEFAALPVARPVLASPAAAEVGTVYAAPTTIDAGIVYYAPTTTAPSAPMFSRVVSYVGGLLR